MSQPFDENHPGYFHADKYRECASPYCRNRLTGKNLSDGEEYCSEECMVDHGIGSDIVLFDDPFDHLEDDDDADE